MKTTTKERPILFSGPMVRALLEGRKSQTRRVLKGEVGPCAYEPGKHALNGQVIEGNPAVLTQCPYGAPGDRLWVRETWALEDCGEDGKRVIWQADRAARWIGDGVDSEVYYLPSDYNPGRWRPSIHIPRQHSRLTLEVTEVRVQRLQEISEEDARAEGVEPEGRDGRGPLTHLNAFRSLWANINGMREGCSWEATPWVWCVSFRMVKP
jgi:hypothetical protein